MSKTYYKGFEKDMTCRGFQFEEGKTYEEPEANLCHSGFHACENPLECWDYYSMMESVFHEVTLEEVCEKREKASTKVCGRKITVGRRLNIGEMVEASVGYITESVKECFKKTLFDKKIVDSGYGAKIGSSGDCAQIGSSGDCAQIGSSGYGAKIGSSGDGAQIGSSGDGAQIGSSGYGAKIEITGANSVGACVGSYGRIKAKKGCWIVLTEWKMVNEAYTPVCVRAEKVDGEKVKEDTWYRLEAGELVECREDEE